MIPSSSNYPLEFDTDENLYEVHDSLRVTLAEDYSPGDTSITIFGDNNIIDKFPATGLITLTEQMSDIDLRAVSFYYSSKTDTQFLGLEILPGFTDAYKPKNITHVTQNVMAAHHNNLKNALVTTEEFVGKKGTEDTMPGGETLEGRTNFLRRLVFTPRAWFTCDKNTGLVPLTIKFTDQSFRLGTGDVTYLWDFGDHTVSNVSTTISVASTIPSADINVLVRDTDGGNIEKTYTKPGKYTVKLTVTNAYGEDIVEIEELINARIEAPDEAQIDFNPRSSQIATEGDETPTFDRLATRPAGPFEDYPPTIRSATNTFVDVEVPSGARLSYDRSYAGEKLDEYNSPIDPVVQYT
jgi:PKD repeat protein